MTLKQLGWEMQESGWWTHPMHGGICREDGVNWWAWPDSGGKRGPYRTALDAAKSFL